MGKITQHILEERIVNSKTLARDAEYDFLNKLSVVKRREACRKLAMFHKRIGEDYALIQTMIQPIKGDK